MVALTLCGQRYKTFLNPARKILLFFVVLVLVRTTLQMYNIFLDCASKNYLNLLLD